jgi:hypothetical protein
LPGVAPGIVPSVKVAGISGVGDSGVATGDGRGARRAG